MRVTLVLLIGRNMSVLTATMCADLASDKTCGPYRHRVYRLCVPLKKLDPVSFCTSGQIFMPQATKAHTVQTSERL